MRSILFAAALCAALPAGSASAVSGSVTVSFCLRCHTTLTIRAVPSGDLVFAYVEARSMDEFANAVYLLDDGAEIVASPGETLTIAATQSKQLPRWYYAKRLTLE